MKSKEKKTEEMKSEAGKSDKIVVHEALEALEAVGDLVSRLGIVHAFGVFDEEK